MKDLHKILIRYDSSVSKKVYEYLLKDENNLLDMTNSHHKIITGVSKSGIKTSNITIVDLVKIDKIPDIVTKCLVPVSKAEFVVQYLSSAEKEKINSPKTDRKVEEKEKVKEVRLDYKKKMKDIVHPITYEEASEKWREEVATGKYDSCPASWLS